MSTTGLLKLDVACVRPWCVERVPERVPHQVQLDYDLAPRHLTIVERAAPRREDDGPEGTLFPIARLRYTTTNKT